MTAPPFAESTRFVDPGSTRVYWVDSIAVLSAPTRIELDAGIDVSGEMAEIEGFALQSETNPTTPFNSIFVTEKPGVLRTTGTPRMVMYADLNGYDIRTLWDRGDTGNIVILHGGDVAGNLMDVWPVHIASVSKTFATADAAFVVVQFTIPATPETNVGVP